MAEVQFIVVTLEGVENLELEADSEGQMGSFCGHQMVGSWKKGYIEW